MPAAVSRVSDSTITDRVIVEDLFGTPSAGVFTGTMYGTWSKDSRHFSPRSALVQ